MCLHESATHLGPPLGCLEGPGGSMGEPSGSPRLLWGVVGVLGGAPRPLGGVPWGRPGALGRPRAPRCVSGDSFWLFEKRCKRCVFNCFLMGGVPRRPSWASWERPRGARGPPRRPLTLCEVPWGALGATPEALGALLGSLGALRGGLGGLWEGPGGSWMAPWAAMGAPTGPKTGLGRPRSKKPRKT